jgi:GT2 family glycosyltransferase
MPFAPLWVVVPTYWGTADTGIYDHPTPLDGKSTLTRLLDSLIQQNFNSQFQTLILVSATSPELEIDATAHVRQLLAPYAEKLNLYLADAETSRSLDQHLASHGLNLDIASMRGYATVRNMQLLIPAALGADIIIAIDDDEVLPENYLQQATKWIGKTHDGQQITGIAGPYLDELGSPYIPEAERVSNILVDKSIFMNKTMRQLMAQPDELVRTPMALGGNMVFHRELFTQVGFDPAITRGEDIDYLINARIAGHTFFFYPKLPITHLPPRHFESSQYAKMRQDVIRFIYEKEKLQLYGLSPDEFTPYPGRLLSDYFVPAALEALHSNTSQETISQFGSPEEIIAFAQAYTKERAPKYAAFAEQWIEANKVLERYGFMDKLHRIKNSCKNNCKAGL